MHMHGCLRLTALAVLLVFLTVGCTEPDFEEESEIRIEEPAAAFNRAATGTICGRVLWVGPAPSAPPFEVLPVPLGGKREYRANPNLPVIYDGAVQQAVLFLRSLNGRRAKLWDHAPVRVEQRDRDIAVFQGDKRVHVGFLQRGDSLEMLSRDGVYYALRARGPDFFTYTFPDPEVIRRRRLRKTGMVELSSGAGHCWARGYVLIADHPYLARTDDEGRFELTQVPAGRYEVVCWMPNWNIRRRDRGPESALIDTVTYAPPLEREQQVVVGRGEAAMVDFAIGATDFADR